MVDKVAIFIDGDNISAAYAGEILRIGETEGPVEIARIYADASGNTNWHAAPGYRMIHSGQGKNASDILLSMDALELALQGAFTRAVIASSDGDFLHIALRLRERGIRVIGIGEAKTPPLFRGACTAFKRIDTNKPAQAAPAPQGAHPVTELDQKIRGMIGAHSQNGRGMRLAELAPKMHAKFGTRISDYPERTWRAYLSLRTGLYDLDPRGPDAHVRYKPKGFRA